MRRAPRRRAARSGREHRPSGSAGCGRFASGTLVLAATASSAPRLNDEREQNEPENQKRRELKGVLRNGSTPVLRDDPFSRHVLVLCVRRRAAGVGRAFRPTPHTAW